MWKELYSGPAYSFGMENEVHARHLYARHHLNFFQPNQDSSVSFLQTNDGYCFPCLEPKMVENTRSAQITKSQVASSSAMPVKSRETAGVCIKMNSFSTNDDFTARESQTEVHPFKFSDLCADDSGLVESCSESKSFAQVCWLSNFALCVEGKYENILYLITKIKISIN